MRRQGVTYAVLNETDPAVRAVLVSYLNALAAGLPGSARSRGDALEEVADGLLDAVDAHAARGLTLVETAGAAVDEFGDPRRLAEQFCAELAGRAAHRVGVALLVTGPLVGAAWVTAYAARAGNLWSDQVPAMWSELPWLGVVLAVTLPAAALAAAAGAGRWTRRMPVGPGGAAAAAMVGCLGCIAGDTILLATLAPTGGWTSLVVPAAALSVARLAAAAAAAHRCASLRAGAA